MCSSTSSSTCCTGSPIRASERRDNGLAPICHLLQATGAVTLPAIIGTLIGSIAGWSKGVLDETIMRITDLTLAFPTVILALVITAALGAGIQNAIIAIMIAWWPSYARLVRGLVLSVRE